MREATSWRHAPCEQVLAENPHDPEALRLQAAEQGDPELALGAMLAVKAVSGRRSADVQKAFWEDLERVFESALSGVDADFTLATRLAYRMPRAASTANHRPPHGELVSVVLVLSDAMTHLGDALASIYNQTYRDIELVVVGVSSACHGWPPISSAAPPGASCGVPTSALP